MLKDLTLQKYAVLKLLPLFFYTIINVLMRLFSPLLILHMCAKLQRLGTQGERAINECGYLKLLIPIDVLTE